MSQAISDRARELWDHHSVSIKALLFSLIGGIVLLYRIPYGFETNDQFQYFILPYRSIYSPFLVGDWFTWQTSHYHLTFSWLIRGLHALFGEGGFPIAVFAVHCAVLCGLAFSLFRLARAIDGGLPASIVGLFVIAFVRRMGIAETTINHGVLLPADMALPLYLIAVSHWIEKSYIKTGVFLGLAGFIHANYAVLGPATIAIPELIVLSRSRDYRSTLKMVSPYLIIASPTLLGIVASFLSTDSAPEALAVLFTVRSPHHYTPTFVNSIDLVFIGALALASLPHFLSLNHVRFRQLSIWGVLLLSQVIAIVATEVQQATLIRLFLWRLSLSFMVVGAVGVGASLDRAWRTRDWARWFCGLSGVVVVAAFSTKGSVLYAPSIELRGFGWMLPSLLLLLFYIPANNTKHPYIRPFRYVFAVFPIGYAMLLSSGLGLVSRGDGIEWESAYTKWSRFQRLNTDLIIGKKRQSPILDWISRKTPRDASFLIPPGTNGFRFEAQRAAFVDWKCCPMKGEEIREWKRRMLAVMGTKRFPAKGYALHRVSNRMYHARSLKELAALARQEGLSHILAKKETGYRAAGLKKLKKKAGWTVFNVRPSSEGGFEQH